MDTEPTVFVVDDDPDIIKAVSELVELIDLKVESYLSADAFLEEYQLAGPGCLVLDVRMPGASGVELHRELAGKGIDLPTIFITGHGDVRMAVEAMKAGAVEFLEKPFRSQELCDSIQKAIRDDVQKWEQESRRENAQNRIAGLTNAEREVMEMVVVGKTNTMIAEELDLSVRAVEDRRARMMRKLRVKTRVQLLQLATV